MEPNIDRSMWGIGVLIIAVVVGVLAKDKIYHAVDNIFGKHSEAIGGIDLGGLITVNNESNEEALDIDPLTQSKFQISTNLSTYGFSASDVAYAESLLASAIATETGFESQGNYIVYPKGETIQLTENQIRKIQISSEISDYLSTRTSNLPKGARISNVINFIDSEWNNTKRVSSLYDYDRSDLSVNQGLGSHLLSVNGTKIETVSGATLTINEDDNIKLITAPWISTSAKVQEGTTEHLLNAGNAQPYEAIKEGVKFNEVHINRFGKFVNDRTQLTDTSFYGYDYYFINLESGERFEPTDTVPTNVLPEYKVVVTNTKLKIHAGALVDHPGSMNSGNNLYLDANNYHFNTDHKTMTFHDVNIGDTVLLDFTFSTIVDTSQGLVMYNHKSFLVTRFDKETGETISTTSLAIGAEYTVRDDEKIMAIFESFRPNQ